MSNDDGEWVEVSWGPALFAPVQYNNFVVGPFKARVQVKPGENREEVAAKALQSLEKIARAEFPKQLEWFRQSLGIALTPVKKRGE